MSEWKSCKIELPPLRKRVLVWTSYGVDVDEIEDLWQTGEAFFAQYGEAGVNVIYWMECPKGPKE